MRDQSHGSDADRQMSLLRRLKLLVVVLIVSNMALGLFGFYYLRAIDHKYSELIDRTVPLMDQMQELTAVSAHAMRGTNPAFFSGPAENQRAAAERAREGLDRDAKLRGLLVQTDWDPTREDEQETLQNAGDTFTKVARQVVDLFSTGRTVEAIKLREESLRPAFERYVAATTEAADLVKAHSLKTSDAFTERTHSISKMMLGLASWPVIALTLFFTVTAALAVVVLLLFDRKVA
jgi:hypothetical protein